MFKSPKHLADQIMQVLLPISTLKLRKGREVTKEELVSKNALIGTSLLIKHSYVRANK